MIESRYRLIDLNALAYNFSAIKSHVGQTLVMPVIKANAYGHGLLEVGRFLQQQNVDYLGVAAIEEAVQLRMHGITCPILVLGSIVQEQVPLFLQHNIDIMAASIEKLVIINEYAQKTGVKAKVHLKIDTGLARLGVRHTSAEQFFKEALRLKNISIVGIASHFATSDAQDTTFMNLQCERFHDTCELFARYSCEKPLRHIANSGGIMQSSTTHFDMVRPGIMIYGVYPTSWMHKLLPLKPVMSLYGRVVYFKVLLKNSGISYGLTWRTPKNTRIITVPVGYGDGYARALSNKGFVLLNGAKYPVVGNVCMDQLMIDIGDNSAYSGDEVVLIGKSKNHEITVNSLVDLYGGSAYEFLIAQNNRIPRHYVLST
jgi:alanine racemase